MGDYFTLDTVEQFNFLRVPKAFFTDPRYKALSSDSKLLYGLLLDRLSLSIKNDWQDKDGHVYIVFTIKNIKEHLNCSSTTAVKALKCLEQEGLVAKRNGGYNAPMNLYVKNFVTVGDSKKWNYSIPKNGITVFQKMESNKTDLNNTDLNNKNTPAFKKQKAERVTFSDQDMTDAKFMLEKIKQYFPKTTPKLESWAKVIKLMREKDEHTRDEIIAVFLWANNDKEQKGTWQGWHLQIRSPDKLRQQFSTLHGQMLASNKPQVSYNGNFSDPERYRNLKKGS